MENFLFVIIGFALGLFVYRQWFHIIDDGIEWVKSKFDK